MWYFECRKLYFIVEKPDKPMDSSDRLLSGKPCIGILGDDADILESRWDGSPYHIYNRLTMAGIKLVLYEMCTPIK